MKSHIHVRQRAHRLPLMIAVLATLASQGGCSEDPSPAREQPAACRADALEADLESEPFTGPGVDEATGELRAPAPGESYVVSSTYGAPKPGALERWGQLMGPIQVQLADQPGLLALRLGSSEACGSGRTLAVWASEEAMYEFVTSPAHAAAMAAAPEVVQPGFRTTHWSATKLEQISFEEGVHQLERARD